MNFLTGFLTHIISTAGIIFLFGWIIALLRRAFCMVAPKSGPKILLATGIVGTPIHELSHALMCLIFGHKITEIKLYTPKAKDGTLGYVNHTYNQRNLYHQIGNFFIGVAPVVLGGGFIVLLMLILMPQAFETISGEISALGINEVGSLPMARFFHFIGASIGAIFDGQNFSNWQGITCIILSVMISTHMEMSGSDIRSGLWGFALILILMFQIDGIIYLISPSAFWAVVGASASFGFILAAFLSISVIFLGALLLIALLLNLIGSFFS